MNIKKIILAAAGFIAAAAVALFFLFVFPFLGTKEIHAGMQFDEGRVVNVADGFTQVFILDGGNRNIALVDAGNSPDGKPVAAALNLKGLAPSDVKAVFLTHGHPDHIGAAKLFTHAKIYAAKEEVETAAGIKNNPSPLGRFQSPKPTGVKVTDIVKDGDVIGFGSLKIEVFLIPGHTQGSTAYLVDGVLILGDAALASSDGTLKHAVWLFSTDIDQQNKSLKTLAAKLQGRKTEVKTILFSHSGSLDGLQPLIDYAAAVD
jgi:glyoxylase-like metal-dependent hydrolase (beta-lactamase superfamily II)